MTVLLVVAVVGISFAVGSVGAAPTPSPSATVATAAVVSTPASVTSAGPTRTASVRSLGTTGGAPTLQSSPTRHLDPRAAGRANLLADPGCEAAGETAPPDGWTDQSPTTPAVYCTSLDGPDDDGTDLTTQTTPEGPLAFADGRADGASKLLVQTVPVTSDRTYELAGWVGTDGALSTADHLDVTVQFRDGAGTTLSTVELTDLRSDTNGTFDRFDAVATAPTDAETAQVRLRFDNADGSGYAAVFVDGVTLRRSGPGVDARNDTLTVPVDASFPPTTLFADTGAGVDRRGTAGATVTTFGGGDLGGTPGDTPAGTTVGLAGGDLTVRADGTVSLSGPTTPGAYAFRYRLSDGTTTDAATVRVRVLNGSRNLLAAPGCEVRTPGGGAVGWTNASGVAAGCLDPAGAAFTTQRQPTGGFAFGDTRTSAAATGEDVTLRQRVAVTPGVTYRLAAEVGTDEALSAADHADLTLRFRDSSGTILQAGSIDLTGLSSDTNDAFDRAADTGTAPPGAATAEVVVRLDNADGTGYADAFVDDLVLRRVDPGVTAVDDGPFVTSAYRTLAPDRDLLADGGLGADGRGPAGNATVATFGGGDLIGGVGTYAAGATATLAGGELTVAPNGTFDLRRPTDPGQYTFRYRLSNGTATDVATVRLRVTALGRTLLGTPGCERHGLADRPLGWSDESGGRAVACLDLRGGSFTALSQPNGTYAFGDRTPDGGNESVVRTVAVTPGRAYALSGRVGTDAGLSTVDEARVDLRYRRANGSLIDGAGATRTGLRSQDGSFAPFEASAIAPPATARAVVRVTLVDRDGGTADAFVDDLALSTAPVAPDARDDGPDPGAASGDPFTVEAGGTLAPGRTLLADNGNGSDDRGFPAASVTSFGGGDLGGTATDYAVGDTARLAGGNLTVAADGSVTVTGPTEGGDHRFRYRLSNAGGTDTATVTIRVLAPEFDLFGTGTPIASGETTPSRVDGTAFGAVPVENGTATTTFTVANTGTEPLRLDGTPRVNVTGPNADEFAVTALPNGTVQAGGATTFTVAFDPTGVDGRRARLSIPSTDGTEDPYAVAIRGQGTDALTATTGPATTVTATAADLSGTVDPGGRSTTVSFEYWPSGSPDDSRTVTADTSPVTGVTDVPVDGTVTGLLPNRRYAYRVVAANANGTVSGANRTFTTPIASPTATTLAAANVTPTGARLRGTVDPGNGSTDVSFVYSPVEHPTVTTVPAAGSPVDGPTPVAVNASLTNLSPETTYAFRAVAVNVAGRDQGANSTVATPSSPPVVPEPGPFAVAETAPNGTVVGDVNATDGEGGAIDDNVTYSLVGGSPDVDGDGIPAVGIDGDDGRLRVTDAADIDHEANASLRLRVRVDDDAGRSTTEVVPVDVTDEPPTLSNGTVGTVSETAPNGTIVGTVPVEGDDTSVNLSLSGGTPNVDGDGPPAFSIAPTTGVVRVTDAADVDHETAGTVELTVEATDGSTTAVATVSVTVTDVDEAPVLGDAGPFLVAETAANGTVFGDLNATDGDGGSSDENVTYAIAGGTPDSDGDGTAAIALDAATGALTVADADDLDHESTASVPLVVNVSDGTTTTTRTVSVDVSDVAPMLSDGPVGTVPETAPNGTVVGTVPVDGDDTSVALSIDGGNPDVDGDGTAAFAIAPMTGTIRIADAADVDHETAAMLELTVEATDATTTATASRRVTVTDVAPTVAGQTLAAVDDDARAGTIVDAVGTGGDDTSVTLSIVGGNPNPDGDGTPAFAIDGAGTVTVADAADVDAGSAGTVELTVEATDGTTTASAPVTVPVTDATSPVADAGPNRTIELGNAVTLTPNGSNDNVGVVEYAWDVGADGTVDGTGPTLSYTPDATGTVPVTLRVRDAAGNEATDRTTVTVVDTTPPTVPAIANRTVDEDTLVAFDATTASDAGPLSFEWTLGDGTTATGPTVSHLYDDPGTYTVTLTVTDGADNVASKTATVTVRDVTPPTVRFAANRTAVLVGEPVRFDAGNSSDTVGIVTTTWTFGDGTAATGATVTHAYDAPGTYPVNVTARDGAGNEATATTSVRVDTRPNLSVAFGTVTDRVTAGAPVTATVRVTNRGTLTGTVPITIAANGTTVATTTATVPGTASERVTLTWTPRDGQAGTYTLTATSPNDTTPTATAPTVTVDPLRVRLAIQRAPSAVSLSDTAVFAVDVTNPGASTVARRVSLVDGPTTVDSRRLTLGPGETRRATLRWNTSGSTAGDHPMAVTTGNVTASTPMVVIPETPFPNGLPGSRQYTPQDVDADPRFEDLDGNGRVNFFDVITLAFADFETINGDAAQQAALDFDDDGDVDFVDAIDLVFQL